MRVAREAEKFMKISDRVEPLVRNTIYAAVKRDFAKLGAALNGTSVVASRPTRETEAIAVEIAQAEAWVEATEAEVVTFLQCLVNGEPFAGVVPAENVYILTFASAANLLASWHRDDEKRWDYLDRAEAAIEAAA